MGIGMTLAEFLGQMDKGSEDMLKNKQAQEQMVTELQKAKLGQTYKVESRDMKQEMAEKKMIGNSPDAKAMQGLSKALDASSGLLTALTTRNKVGDTGAKLRLLQQEMGSPQVSRLATSGGFDPGTLASKFSEFSNKIGSNADATMDEPTRQAAVDFVKNLHDMVAEQHGQHKAALGNFVQTNAVAHASRPDFDPEKIVKSYSKYNDDRVDSDNKRFEQFKAQHPSLPPSAVPASEGAMDVIKHPIDALTNFLKGGGQAQQAAPQASPLSPKPQASPGGFDPDAYLKGK